MKKFEGIMKNMVILMGSRSSVLELLYLNGSLNQQMDTMSLDFMEYFLEVYYLLLLGNGGMEAEIWIRKVLKQRLLQGTSNPWRRIHTRRILSIWLLQVMNMNWYTFNRILLIKEIELQQSLEHDRYKHFGTATFRYKYFKATRYSI